MALFWLTIILLSVFAMLAIAWPLLKPLKINTPDQKWLAVLSIVIPLSIFVWYVLGGGGTQLALSTAIENSVMAASDQKREAAHQEVVKLLEKITKTHPDEFDAWYKLGDFCMQTKQYKKATDAFGHAASLQPDNADALAQYAQALYFADDKKLTFAMTSSAEQALKINPDQPVALGLMGITAFENKHYQQAIIYWQKILWAMREQDVGAQSAKKGIELAKNLLQQQGQWMFIDVDLSLDASVVAAPSQWVWVSARLPHQKVPIAVVKVRVADLPKRVILDDTAATPEGILLSAVDRVEVVATLSTKGTAAPSEPDKEVVSSPVAPSTTDNPIKLVIK